VLTRILACLVLFVLGLAATRSTATAETERRTGWIVYWSENPWPSIWVLPPNGSRGRRILENRQSAKRPRVSPDRTWVAFDGAPPGKPVLSDFDVQVVGLNGTGLHTLTNSSDWDLDAQWSPDGNWLSFTRNPPSPIDCSNSSVWIMRRDGSDLRRIVAGCGARWSPDGHRLVYTSTRGKGLFVVNIGGGAPRRLLTGRLPQAAAGWSRSGRVLFTRSHDHIGRIADVMVTNADGTGVRKLADGFAGSWSPRGTRILYTKTFFSALFVMNADGSHKHRVSRAIAAEPDWR
jgi:Tol biopolymer transport system component